MNSFKKDNPTINIQNKKVKTTQAVNFHNQTSNLQDFVASRANQSREEVDSLSFSDVEDAVLGVFGKASKDTAVEVFEQNSFTGIDKDDIAEVILCGADSKNLQVTMKDGSKYLFVDNNGELLLESFTDKWSNQTYYFNGGIEEALFKKIYNGSLDITRLSVDNNGNLSVTMETGEIYRYHAHETQPYAISTSGFTSYDDRTGDTSFKHEESVRISLDSQEIAPYINENTIIIPMGNAIFLNNGNSIFKIDKTGTVEACETSLLTLFDQCEEFNELSIKWQEYYLEKGYYPTGSSEYDIPYSERRSFPTLEHRI